MFDKNDKALLAARKIIIAVLVICAVCGFISGIVLCTTKLVLPGILVMVFSILLNWITWIFVNLFLCFLCDVKLIRNKLYDVDNSNLSEFLNEKK